MSKMGVLFLIVFLASLGSAIPYTIFAPLFLDPNAGTNFSSPDGWFSKSFLLGVTLATYPFGQFLGSPILGSLSDRLGRKVVLISSMFGACVCYTLTGFSIYLGSVSLLIGSRLLSGFFEGNLAIAQAYIADMKVDKMKGFGGINAASSLGYVFGPMIGGIFTNRNLHPDFNHSLPFYIASAIGVLSIFGILLFLKETRMRPVHQRESIVSQFNVVSHFSIVAKDPTLKWLLIGGLMSTLAIDSFYEFYPAMMVTQWQLDSHEIAIFTMVLSLALCAGGYWLPKYLTNRSPQQNLILLSTLFPLVMVTMAFIRDKGFLYFEFLAIGLTYSAGCTFHTILISQHAGDQQGRVMGVRWGLRMLGSALSCLFGGFLISYSPFFPIGIGAAFGLIGAFIFLFL